MTFEWNEFKTVAPLIIVHMLKRINLLTNAITSFNAVLSRVLFILLNEFKIPTDEVGEATLKKVWSKNVYFFLQNLFFLCFYTQTKQKCICSSIFSQFVFITKQHIQWIIQSLFTITIYTILRKIFKSFEIERE